MKDLSNPTNEVCQKRANVYAYAAAITQAE